MIAVRAPCSTHNLSILLLWVQVTEPGDVARFSERNLTVLPLPKITQDEETKIEDQEDETAAPALAQLWMMLPGRALPRLDRAVVKRHRRNT